MCLDRLQKKFPLVQHKRQFVTTLEVEINLSLDYLVSKHIILSLT